MMPPSVTIVMMAAMPVTEPQDHAGTMTTIISIAWDAVSTPRVTVPPAWTAGTIAMPAVGQLHAGLDTWLCHTERRCCGR
jgi:hypothetical protein